MLTTASAQVCVPLGHSSLYYSYVVSLGLAAYCLKNTMWCTFQVDPGCDYVTLFSLVYMLSIVST